jgi:hypothetical protein
VASGRFELDCVAFALLDLIDLLPGASDQLRKYLLVA